MNDPPEKGGVGIFLPGHHTTSYEVSFSDATDNQEVLPLP